MKRHLKRVIFDLPLDVQMAIRLRAVKWGCTTGEVVELAIRESFKDDVREAQDVLLQTIKDVEALTT